MEPGTRPDLNTQPVVDDQPSCDGTLSLSFDFNVARWN
jgi:hypothetical protein